MPKLYSWQTLPDRFVIGGALAMVVTYVIGHLFDTAIS